MTAAHDFLVALRTAADDLWNTDPADPKVLVTYGMPAFDTFDDIVSFGSTTSDSEPATLGPRRQREETLEQEVLFYVFRAGDSDQEAVVLDRTYELLGQLEEWVRVNDTTLKEAVGASDVVRHCFLVNHATDQATDQSLLSKGRLRVLTATFQAVYRITS